MSFIFHYLLRCIKNIVVERAVETSKTLEELSHTATVASNINSKQDILGTIQYLNELILEYQTEEEHVEEKEQFVKLKDYNAGEGIDTKESAVDDNNWRESLRKKIQDIILNQRLVMPGRFQSLVLHSPR
jgi:hypothetical protein